MNITRDQFKFLAAGKCVYGKGQIDPKHLELYIEGAMMAWDYLINNGRTQPIARLDELIYNDSNKTKLQSTKEN